MNTKLWRVALAVLYCTSMFVLVSCVNHEFERTLTCLEYPFSISLISKTNGSSCNSNDGTITIGSDNGTGNIMILVNGVYHDGITHITGLHEGTYVIEAIDPRGCSDTLMVTIGNSASMLSADISVTADSECLTDNGMASIEPTGSSPPYRIYYMQELVTGSNLVGLAHGTHGIVIEDSQGCSSEVAVTIPRSTTDISWTNDVRGIIQTSCCKSGCHIEGTGRIDFTKFSNVKAYAAAIKSKTQNRSMPYDGTLPDDQIQMIACWVDDGAPAN